MSVKRSAELLREANHANLVITDTIHRLRDAAARRNWQLAEELRADAVAAFEAMLDASIAAQREAARE